MHFKRPLWWAFRSLEACSQRGLWDLVRSSFWPPFQVRVRIRVRFCFVMHSCQIMLTCHGPKTTETTDHELE